MMMITAVYITSVCVSDATSPLHTTITVSDASTGQGA